MSKDIITVTLNPAMDKTITLEKIEIGGLNRLKQTPKFDPGGKGINVAKVLHAFGMNVITTGFIAGELGERLEKQLQQLGIKSDFIEVNGNVRTNMKIIELSTNCITEVNEPGFTVTEEAVFSLKNKISSLLDHVSFLVLSGSLPSGIDAGVYNQFIKLAKEKGVKVILDADSKPLTLGIEAKPYAIKPNLYELEQYSNRPLTNIEDIVAVGRCILENGVRLVCVSLGEKGAVFLSSDEGYHIKPFLITPKSSIGAGDAMVATIAYSHLQGFSLMDSARWATAAGTITATKEGTNVCTLDEVKEAFTKMQAVQLY